MGSKMMNFFSHLDNYMFLEGAHKETQVPFKHMLN